MREAPYSANSFSEIMASSPSAYYQDETSNEEENTTNYPIYDYRESFNLTLNTTVLPPLPIDMRFNDGHQLAIVIYTLLMFWSTIGNVSVLVIIIRFVFYIKSLVTLKQLFILIFYISQASYER